MSKINIMKSLHHCLLLIGLLFLASPSFSGEVLQDVPTTINNNSKYIFFLHGNVVEKKSAASIKTKDYGFYEYKKILNALAQHDFTVISDVHVNETKIKPYAKKIAGQVNALIAKGVPPGNITVAGLTKGGKITLVTSTLVGNENVNYVVLSGCMRKSKKFIEKFSLDLKGRVLSIVDYSDETFSSCEGIFKSSSGGLEKKEIILKEGRGHRVFYTPNDKWINPMIDWIK